MRHAMEILQRRKWTFLLPFLIVFILPSLYIFMFMRTYEANSFVWFDADANIVPVLNQPQTSTSGKPIQEQADAIQQLLQSRAFVTKVIAKTPLQSKMTTDRQRSRTIAFVQKNMQIAVVGPNSLKIVFFGQTPGQAVQVVGKGTDTFLEWVRQAVRQQNQASITFFENRSKQYLAELDNARANLQSFMEENPEAAALDIQDKVLTSPKITATPAVQAEFASLKEQQTYAETLYRDSLTDLAKTRVLAAAKEEQYLTGLRVVDRPIVPTSFAKKRMLLACFLAFVAAVAVGAAAVTLAEYMDPTLRSSDDVEGVLSLPVLAEIRRRSVGGDE